MKTFLLDTCVLSALLHERRAQDPKVQKFLESIVPERDVLYVSPIAIAEIKYGYKVCLAGDEARKLLTIEKLRQYRCVPINEHTTDDYARVRAALFRKYGTPETKRGLKTIKERHPEDLIDRSTAKSLGIQENDLWSVACALQYNMIFVTSDKMCRLREIVQEDLKLPLRWESWGS